MKVPPTAAARPVLVGVGVLVAAVLLSVLLSVSACTEQHALVLLDLRVSGPLGAPVALVRLSAPGWDTRTVSGEIGPEGFHVGYYGPADGDAVSVTAEALDDAGCVLGRGTATVPALESGATSDPTPLFIRPVPDSGCQVAADDARAD